MQLPVGRFFFLESLAVQGPLLKKDEHQLGAGVQPLCLRLPLTEPPLLCLSPSPRTMLSSGNRAVLANASMCLPGFCELDAQQCRHATGGGLGLQDCVMLAGNAPRFQHLAWSPRLRV